MKKAFNNFKFLLIICFYSSLFSAEHQFILSGSNKLDNYTVIIKEEDIFLISDKKGLLSSPIEKSKETFFLKEGTYTFEIIQGESIEKQKVVINEQSPKIIKIKVKNTINKNETFEKLDEFIITSKSKVTDSSISTLTANEAKLIPGSGGDILKSVVNLPGVSSTSTFTPSLYVRGMSRFDVNYGFDGIRTGNPFHALGFYSAFPSSSIEGLSFYPGAFPALFGNTQGSVMDIHSKKTFNQTKATGEIDLNVASAGFQMSIPIGDQLYLSFGGRRTFYESYINALENLEGLDFATDIFDVFEISPFFYDYNIKLDWNINKRHKLYFINIASQDVLSLNFKNQDGTSEKGVSFKDDWNVQGLVYEYESKLLENRLVLYHFENKSDFNIANAALGWQSFINNTLDYAIGNQLKWQLNSDFLLIHGIKYTYQSYPFVLEDYIDHTFDYFDNGLSPEDKFKQIAEDRKDSKSQETRRQIIESYGELDFVLGSFKAQLGVNTLWNDITPQFFTLDPRLIIEYSLTDTLKFYFKTGRYSQLPRLQQINSLYGIPSLKNSEAHHYVLGSKTSFFGFDFRAEGYFNNLFNQIILNPTFDQAFDSTAKKNPKYLDNGTGYTYGLELFLKRKIINGIFGWISYTYSKSSRNEYPFYDSFTASQDPNNNGLDYKFLENKRFEQVYTYEREHIFSSVLVFPLMKGLILGARMSLVTGEPFEEQEVGYEDVNNNGSYEQGTDQLRFEPKNKNTANTEYLPIKYTFDVRIEYTININKRMKASFYLDFWNLQFPFYKNKNNYIYDEGVFNPDSEKYIASLRPGQEAPFTDVNDFPLLPIFGLKLTF